MNDKFLVRDGIQGEPQVFLIISQMRSSPWRADASPHPRGDDIDRAYERLRTSGAHVNSPPHEFSDADEAPDVKGVRFVYFRDPDGIQLELNQPARR